MGYVRWMGIRYVTNGCWEEMKELPHDLAQKRLRDHKDTHDKNSYPKTAKTSQHT